MALMKDRKSSLLDTHSQMPYVLSTYTAKLTGTTKLPGKFKKDVTTNLATNKNHAGFWDRQSTDLKMFWWRTSHWYSIDWSSKSLWYKKPWNPFKKIECNRFMCKDAPFRSFLLDQTYWVHINHHFETVFLKNVF